MSVWLTPQQIARMRLACMPTHEVSIRRMCQKNLIVYRSKERGKGIEISLDSMPIEAQRDYYARFAQSSASGGEPTPAGMPSTADTSRRPPAGGLAGGGGPADDGATLVGAVLAARSDADRARAEEAHRRYTIIAPIIHGQISGRAAIEQHAAAHGKTAATIYRWVAAYRHGGAQALADGPRRDAGQARALISQQWEQAAKDAGITQEKRIEIARRITEVVRGLWAQTTRPSWSQVAALAYPELYRLSVDAGMPEAAARKACRLKRRFVEGERRFSVIALAERDAKGFYDRVVTSIRRSRAQLMPGDVVFGDVSPADIPVLRADGSIGWARLIAWRDAATNMWHITGYLAEKGSGVRREHIALAFAQMCQEAPWGMPRRMYLDNGSEYSWTTMLDAWAALVRFSGGAFAGLWGTDALGEDGRIWRTEPFRPRAKLIEGGFANLLTYMGWHPHFAGGDRMTKKTRALGRPVEPVPLDDLKRFIGEAVQFYHAMPQGGFLGGLSPIEKLEQCQARGFRRLTVDAATLELAFGETFERRVRAGQVEVGGWYYHDPLLYQWQDERVIVRWARFSPDAAYVFHPRTKALMCVALPAPVFAFADRAGAEHAKRLAREARRAVEVMRGQVAWLDPRDLMGEFARLANVPRAIERSREGEVVIELAPEVKAMVEARRQAALAAIERAAPKDHALVANRHGVVDEEADMFRQWLDDDGGNDERSGGVARIA